MPSAIDALSGDMKTLESANDVLTSLRRLKPNVFAAPTISASTVVSWRGRAEMTGGVSSPGPAASEHAAAARNVARASNGILRRVGGTTSPGVRGERLLGSRHPWTQGTLK